MMGVGQKSAQNWANITSSLILFVLGMVKPAYTHTQVYPAKKTSKRSQEVAELQTSTWQSRFLHLQSPCSASRHEDGRRCFWGSLPWSPRASSTLVAQNAHPFLADKLIIDEIATDAEFWSSPQSAELWRWSMMNSTTLYTYLSK